MFDRLNLGCGKKPVNGAINLDRLSDTGADLIHDLNQLPWPLPDNHFSEVLANDVVEHLEDFIATMEEIHRICRDGAIIRITVPHYTCANAFRDPTHRRFFSYFSMDYLTGENGFEFYTPARFKKRISSLIFYPSLLNKVVWRLANRFPTAYERRWAWMFPAWYLYFELEVQKLKQNHGQDNRATAK
jgi:SAM-dependent methyltransferase